MVDFSFLKGEIIAYPLQCEVNPEYNSCPGKTLFSLRMSHYKPNVERQDVLHWVGGFSPDLIKDCAVVDRKNWKCQYDDKSATFGFQNGQFFNISTNESSLEKEFYVSRSVFIHRSCEGSIFAKWYCIPLFNLLRSE